MAKIEKMVIGYINGMISDVYTIKYASGTVRSFNTRSTRGMRYPHMKFLENANKVTPIYDDMTGEHIMDIYE